MKRIVTAEAVRSLLILLFAYTALSKLYGYTQFEDVLAQLPLVSSGAGLLAWMLPLTELCVVLLLLFSKTKRLGLYSSLVLLSVFTGYLIFMMSTASHLPCNCGGVISSMSWPTHLVFNTSFLLLNIIALRWQPTLSNPLQQT